MAARGPTGEIWLGTIAKFTFLVSCTCVSNLVLLPQNARFTHIWSLSGWAISPVQNAGNNGTEKLLSTLDRVSCTNYFMSIEIIRCSVRRIETTKPDKKDNLWQNHIVYFQYDATMRRCWVTAETNDGSFDAANANKSCVRVHGGQSPEFPIYPTTRERGISPSQSNVTSK